MSRRTRRLLTATVAAGLALSVGSAALAAPVGALKQFKVPTARSEPRAITNGSDGNRWFTEGNDTTGAPAKVGRVTPSGTITEFAADCNFCILTDIDQGPDGILYMTSNDAELVRFNANTQTSLPPLATPNSGSTQELVVDGTDVWIIANFGRLVRYDTTTGQFVADLDLGFQPSDVVIDSAGSPWVTSSNDQTIKRLNSTTGAVVESFPVPNGLTPSEITIATDGQIWFTSRFALPNQGVGRVNPTTGVVTTFPLTNVGPQGIAASPSGGVWFTQESKGNAARIDNGGVITESKAVKGSLTFGIIVAPNGDPWYTMMSANKIATFQSR